MSSERVALVLLSVGVTNLHVRRLQVITIELERSSFLMHHLKQAQAGCIKKTKNKRGNNITNNDWNFMKEISGKI